MINQKNRASKRKTKKKQFSSVSLKSGQEGKKARKQAALCSSIHLIRVTNGIWQWKVNSLNNQWIFMYRYTSGRGSLVYLGGVKQSWKWAGRRLLAISPFSDATPNNASPSAHCTPLTFTCHQQSFFMSFLPSYLLFIIIYTHACDYDYDSKNQNHLKINGNSSHLINIIPR